MDEKEKELYAAFGYSVELALNTFENNKEMTAEMIVDIIKKSREQLLGDLE